MIGAIAAGAIAASLAAGAAQAAPVKNVRDWVAQAIGAIETFKKTFPPRWRASRGTRASVSTR
jgi:hypothetical protein